MSLYHLNYVCAVTEEERPMGNYLTDGRNSLVVMGGKCHGEQIESRVC